jgi:hypothetical protein
MKKNYTLDEIFNDEVFIEMEKENKKNWIFNHGGECTICHRPEMTELNEKNICFDCYI